mgnify:CR=1 FL=1
MITPDDYQDNLNLSKDDNFHEAKPLTELYEDWFLEYASYVILERAIPKFDDGLKPVQRRIFHAMKEMDDGRFHKVANIIGQTMQFHPHGDTAIGDALVNIGQKDLMLDIQGNWGDVRTGDRAAAARYIESRLSKFALDIAFKKEITQWQASYDGRKNEPVQLPMKFPLLLAQGVEGIAVGLSTKIMPHNFVELIKASIAILNDKPFKINPDFQTGGIADFTLYNQGKKGGKVRLRSKIDVMDKKTLAIRNVPYSVTTTVLIDSILKANDNGKIKIRKVEDNTAEHVEIMVHLTQGISPEVTIDALYAFTQCEISISPNCCVIIDDRPEFISVSKLLKLSTDNTVNLLRQELELLQKNLSEKWHLSSLEKIFIENRIYRDIEECETWDAVIQTIHKGLKPFKKILNREVIDDDIVKLTEIKIKRISKFDSFKADEIISSLEVDLDEVSNDLSHLTEYAIRYFNSLLKKYGAGRDRRTEIATFESIALRSVAVANQKLYVNREEGFIGSNLKKDEYIGDCSDIDNIIVFRADGKYQITQIGAKKFVGKGVIHVAVWRKSDEHMVYNIVYRDGKAGKSMVKRFSVTSIVRDREYDVTGGKPDSIITYFTANPNSESEVVAVNLHGLAKVRIKSFDFDFGELGIKGRGSKGNILSRHSVRKIVQKSVGNSTLGGRDIWLDKNIGRLTTEDRGTYLGSFNTDDLIAVIHEDGTYELTSFDLSNRYKYNEIKYIGKFDPEHVISAVHYDGKSKSYYVKRFQIETSTTGKQFKFISEERGSKLLLVSVNGNPELVFNYRLKNGDKRSKEIILLDFIDVKGWKANGNKLGGFSRMSGFKINELQIDAQNVEVKVKIDLPITDIPLEKKEVLTEPPKDANGDELSLF